MTNTVACLTTMAFAEQIENDAAQAPNSYRIRRCFAAVQFDLAGRGRIVSLPEGAELHLIGPSCLRECFEVTHGTGHYNVFKVDLLGPWSTVIKTSRVKRIRTLAALEACA